MSAPLALPLRGGGAVPMAISVITRTTGCDRANVGGSTSTFVSPFAHRPLPNFRGCRGYSQMGIVYTTSLICRHTAEEFLGGVGFSLVIMVFAK